MSIQAHRARRAAAKSIGTLLLALTLLSCAEAPSARTATESLCALSAQLNQVIDDDEGRGDADRFEELAEQMANVLTDESVPTDLAGPALAIPLALEARRRGNDAWYVYLLGGASELGSECIARGM